MADSKQHSLFSFLYLRKVPTVVWVLVLLGVGLMAYRGMVKEALPDLEVPTFYITTDWPGATASMVEKSVTVKIEQELRGIQGVNKIRSSSVYSSSLVAVVFDADCKVSDSLRKLESRLAMVRGDLPSDAKQPKVDSSSVSDIPIATVALSGKTDKAVLERLARRIEVLLERVNGIRRVDPVGLRQEIVHVQLLPSKLKLYGIPATLVRQKIRSNGHDAAWGRFNNRAQGFTLQMTAAYSNLDDLRKLAIANHKGVVVRLEQLAVVRLAHMHTNQRASLSWKGSPFVPVVGLAMLKSPGRDTLALLKSAREVLTSSQQAVWWPKGVEWRLTGDMGEVITTELERGSTNGWQAMLAVFLVLLVLLTWREAVSAALCVPLTFMGTAAILWAMGYTLNLLVIVGMVLALGLLVDDFILIMEGMHEGLFVRGLGYAKSVKRTLSLYAVPSFSGSVTTILVFAPLAFVGGVDGKFLRVIPVTAAVCLCVSYVVSILIGPTFLRAMLMGTKKHAPSAVDRISERMENRLSTWLKSKVVTSRKRALLWLACAVLIFFLSLVASDAMRTTLYPDEDGRTLGVTVELASGTPFSETVRVAERVGEILRKKKYIEHIMAVAGAKDGYTRSGFHDAVGVQHTPNIFGFACFLVVGKERDKLAIDYAQPLRKELKKALEDLPGTRVYIKAARGGPTEEDAVGIDITGTDLVKLREIADKVKRRLNSMHGVYDVRDTFGPKAFELQYVPDQASLMRNRITLVDFASQMQAYLENEKVGRYHRSGVKKDLDIRLGAWWNSAGGSMDGPQDWNELARLAVISDDGRVHPLRTLAQPSMQEAFPVIRHVDGLRSVTVLAKNKGIHVTEIINQMHPFMQDLKKSWPVGYGYVFVGEKEADTTYANMGIAFVAAILLVYAVLALLFDSLLYPLIILSTVLFAMTGVFFGFMAFGIPFSFSAAMGIVALVGIVVNDAIIVVETIRARKREGHGVAAAAAKGAADRLRPIISTTVTNFAGLAPLALSDPGWAPICQAIIFGEITATFGAVILIPALYVLLTREKAV